MKLYHGIRLYAVDSRDVGTFGGRATRATIKIYDGSCANTPRAVIAGAAAVNDFRVKAPGTREGTELFLRSFLPGTDPYRVDVK